MNSHDLLHFYKLKEDELLQNNNSLIAIFQRICASLTVVRDGPFKKIFIKEEVLKGTESKVIKKLKTYYKNNFERPLLGSEE